MTVRTGSYTLCGIRKMRRESTPWWYSPNDPRYARDWPYTLLIYHGGFMQRIYDWQGKPKVVSA